MYSCWEAGLFFFVYDSTFSKIIVRMLASRFPPFVPIDPYSFVLQLLLHAATAWFVFRCIVCCMFFMMHILTLSAFFKLLALVWRLLRLFVNGGMTCQFGSLSDISLTIWTFYEVEIEEKLKVQFEHREDWEFVKSSRRSMGFRTLKYRNSKQPKPVVIVIESPSTALSVVVRTPWCLFIYLFNHTLTEA
jgi:hypothetical protein